MQIITLITCALALLSVICWAVWYSKHTKTIFNDQETEKTGEGNTGASNITSVSSKQNYNRLEAIDDWFPENKLTEYV